MVKEMTFTCVSLRWTWSSEGFLISACAIIKTEHSYNMNDKHKEGISGVSAERDFHRSPAVITSSIIRPASCPPEMPNFSVTQFIMTLSMFSVVPVPPLSLHQGRAVITPYFDLCDIHLLNFSTRSIWRYTRGCQLPTRGIRRQKQWTIYDNKTILAENTELAAEHANCIVCCDVTVNSNYNIWE